MNGRTKLFLALALASIAACSKKKSDQTAIPTVTIGRQNIIVTAQATGTVAPEDTVPVKSQASGLVMKMPVEIGQQVKPGDLLVQIDTRTLTNDYNRTKSAQIAAEANVTVTKAALQRSNDLYAQKVITADEHELAIVNAANAKSQLSATQAAFSTAQQQLDYATLRSQVSGTVISKTAAVGTVVSSATSNVGGGSTILTVADLHHVRIQALVNETDVGNVHAGLPVSVTIDAFPGRQFAGTVEKVQPQAVIQNSVTMFPVLVSLPNTDLALLPGMNGEVSIITQNRQNVITVPNDAVRSMKDAPGIGAELGVSQDTMDALTPSRGSFGGGGASGTASRTASGGTPQGGRTGGGARGGNRGGGFQRGRAGAAGAAGAVTAGNNNRNSGDTSGSAGTAIGAPVVAFVKTPTGWSPRLVRLGVSDFDNTEVISGLKVGDEVALLATVALQASRDQNSARIKRFVGGGLPGTGSANTKPAARPAGGGRPR